MFGVVAHCEVRFSPAHTRCNSNSRDATALRSRLLKVRYGARSSSPVTSAHIAWLSGAAFDGPELVITPFAKAALEALGVGSLYGNVLGADGMGAIARLDEGLGEL